MKWITHQAGALTMAVWFQADPVITAAMLGGAVLPDFAEQALCRGNRKLFLRIHRGFLHWFGIYAAMLLLAVVVPLDARQKAGLAGLAIGALSHLMLDGLNPTGVPLLPFREKPRLRWNLISTGSMGEWIFLAALLVLLALGGYEFGEEWLQRIFRLARTW